MKVVRNELIETFVTFVDEIKLDYTVRCLRFTTNCFHMILRRSDRQPQMRADLPQRRRNMIVFNELFDEAIDAVLLAREGR